MQIHTCQLESRVANSLDKPVKGVLQIPHSVFEVAILNGLDHTTAQMVFKDDLADTVKRRTNGRNLNQDIRAGSILLHHTLYSMHMSFDTGKAFKHSFLDLMRVNSGWSNHFSFLSIN
jgi:hypothetical protein